MTLAKWRHNYYYTYSRGRVKAECKPCGESSPWFKDSPQMPVELTDWCNRHTGTKEREAKQHAVS